MSNEITLPELMPPQSNCSIPIFRKRKLALSAKARALAAVFVLCAIVGIFFVINPSSSPDTTPPDNSPPAATHETDQKTDAPQKTEGPTSTAAESIPVVLPIESEPSADTQNSAEEKETEPTCDSEEISNPIPDGAFPIKEVSFPTQHAEIINLTPHTFNTDQLEIMASGVIAPNQRGATVLVISTHTSECFLPTGALYYHPNEHKTHSENPAENMVAVAKAFCDTLADCGIEAVHVTAQCDSSGSSKAYINARNEIATALAQNPNIKYVIDIERASETDSLGNLIRTSVPLGQKSYAPIKLTVSGAGSLGYSRICQNLSLALQLNALISEQSASLTRPVQIADAVYTDGNSPRSLKIEIGSYTSTLDEAVSSSKLLAELFALLLNS